MDRRRLWLRVFSRTLQRGAKAPLQIPFWQGKRTDQIANFHLLFPWPGGTNAHFPHGVGLCIAVCVSEGKTDPRGTSNQAGSHALWMSHESARREHGRRDPRRPLCSVGFDSSREIAARPLSPPGAGCRNCGLGASGSGDSVCAGSPISLRPDLAWRSPSVYAGMSSSACLSDQLKKCCPRMKKAHLPPSSPSITTRSASVTAASPLFSQEKSAKQPYPAGELPLRSGDGNSGGFLLCHIFYVIVLFRHSAF